MTNVEHVVMRKAKSKSDRLTTTQVKLAPFTRKDLPTVISDHTTRDVQSLQVLHLLAARVETTMERLKYLSQVIEGERYQKIDDLHKQLYPSGADVMSRAIRGISPNLTYNQVVERANEPLSEGLVDHMVAEMTRTTQVLNAALAELQEIKKTECVLRKCRETKQMFFDRDFPGYITEARSIMGLDTKERIVFKERLQAYEHLLRTFNSVTPAARKFLKTELSTITRLLRAIK